MMGRRGDRMTDREAVRACAVWLAGSLAAAWGVYHLALWSR